MHLLDKLSAWLKLEGSRPRKQKRTVKQLHADLVALGFDGSYGRISAFARAWKTARLRKQQTAGRGAFVPLVFQPGEAFQFDWSEDWAIIGGERTKLQAAHSKLCYSRAFIVRAYLLQTYEILFDAHVQAFRVFGGVPRRGIYDNMRTAVDRVGVGKQRQVNVRFSAMASHYLLDTDEPAGAGNIIMEDVAKLNQQGWDSRVEEQDVWTRPVSTEDVDRVRRGEWNLILTPTKPVPRDWFGEVTGRDLLCLASGGGQQQPILAAAGARVTVFDASPKQLAQDEMVAKRDGLVLTTRLGFMHDLSCFADASFNLIFHPASNCFAPEITPVWRECFRVLRAGGVLLVGFMNPDVYIFDKAAEERGEFVCGSLCHTLT